MPTTTDLISSFRFCITGAPKEYDYSGTIEISTEYVNIDALPENIQYILDRTLNPWRIVMVRTDDAYQIPRYESGLYLTYVIQI